MRSASTSEYTTPEAFAKETGWSERRVRRVARELGACRVMGNRMILTSEDVKTILEACKPPPSPIPPRISRAAAPPVLSGGYLEARRLLSRKIPGESAHADLLVFRASKAPSDRLRPKKPKR